MKKIVKSTSWRLLGLAALAAAFVGLGARSAAASEFEIVATSFTVDNQVNLSSAVYFNTSATMPGSPNGATTGMTTPGGLYFDGTFYKVWNNSNSSWVQLATGTVSTGGASGSGTANHVARWTATGSVLGDSTMEDDGAGHVGVGAAASGALLNTAGTGDLAFNNVGYSTFTNTGNVTVTPTGYVNVLGLTVGKGAGNVTTLYSGAGTAIPIAKIK